MSVRRLFVYLVLTLPLVLLSFWLGSLYAADRGEQRPSDVETQAKLIADIKTQLQQEMGLLPARVLRQRRHSFVELNASDDHGNTKYGTAGYLGGGYFITVKHAVVQLGGAQTSPEPAAKSLTIRYDSRDVPARLIDAGDADVEVHPGDWAIIKVDERLDLPPLRINTTYAYEFANPIYRLGNDYSKGIILSGGYVGQRTASGLVTCLTDGHPGVSGGGILDQDGDFVGIPIGRLDGDFRFSFILPLRSEMFRSVPSAIARRATS